MKLIRCQKCGTVVISEEAFLQNIMDAMTDASRKARNARYAERAAFLHEASEYKTMYKAFMHHLTERDRAANNEQSYMLSEMRRHVERGGTVSAENFQSLCEKGKARAIASRAQEDRELERIYGRFETICNRTKLDPVEREALKRCENGGRNNARH